MHIEILVEDSSGAALLGLLIPKILGPQGGPHTWRLFPYKGTGRIPHDLAGKTDPSKRILLDRLPRLLQGYGKTPGIDAVIVIVDADKRNCTEFLAELKAVAESCNPAPNTLFRLAIEEIEAWYLGDKNALSAAYPKAKQDVLARYQQDSACDTWELLADAIYPGGVSAINSIGYPLAGQVKHEWATRIGPHMDIEQNASQSFGKLRDGLRRLVTRQ